MKELYLNMMAGALAFTIPAAISFAMAYFKESRRNLKMESDRLDLIDEIAKYQRLCAGIDDIVIDASTDGVIRLLGMRDDAPGKNVVIKTFVYDSSDSDDREFAVRNAAELIDEIEKA